MARSFIITHTFAGIEASAARGIETAGRAMPHLARLFFGRGMAALALAVVACVGAPVAWGQGPDIDLSYTARGKDPINLYWKGKFLKKRKLGPINFEKCPKNKDESGIYCASTVMYTGKKDKYTLESFDYCKDNTNQFTLKAYQKNAYKDAYSGFEIPVIYFCWEARDNLSLHILKINKHLFSSLPLKARRIENRRKSKAPRSDVLLHPVVLSDPGDAYAPQPVIVVCDSTGGYEGSCDSSDAARDFAAQYIKPGSSYWTAPRVENVQSCVPNRSSGGADDGSSSGRVLAPVQEQARRVERRRSTKARCASDS